MLITTSYHELEEAKQAIDEFKENKPGLYQRFKQIIDLTRQLQFNYQYMGCLIMNEEPSSFRPQVQNAFILSVYQKEVEQLKSEQDIQDLQALLGAYKHIGYGNVSSLLLGKQAYLLVGPAVI
ncbi:hypothetical protein [Virgibacillus salexigens]|uniref:hypothetical protein n=1 Tax=Virgibacillus salexigens TaxID=61016 RepID=UPI00190E4F7A|nr:hypothetical protein [Virgibacillus salexigens]